MGNISSQPKERIDRTVIAQSKWVTFYKDRVLSNGGEELEYWCADRSDSAIVLVRQAGHFLLTEPQYRPGINQQTLDFPGGRIDSADPRAAAEQIVRRELQLDDSLLLQLEPLTGRPLFVDSAFSSQKLFGFTLELPADLNIDAKRYTADELTDELQCLQCRSLLLEWLARQK